jgi:Uncharacterized protein conserved in bacteria
MTTESGQAAIRLESVQDGETHIQTLRGDWVRKGRSLFIRYTETADDGGAETRTTIRYAQGELSVTRRGAVESEQRFVPGARTRGAYRSFGAVIELFAETDRLRLLDGGGRMASGIPDRPPLTLEWQYALYVEDQMSGRFHIRLHLREEQQ